MTNNLTRGVDVKDDTPIRRTCAKCGVEKSLDDFNRSKNAPLGRDARCRECRVAYLRQRRKSDPEAIRASAREYRAKNHSRIRAQERVREARPERRGAALANTRAWRLANPEESKAQSIRWRKENVERERERQRKWREDNPDLARAMVRTWNQRNPTSRLLSAQARRARIAGSTTGPIDLENLWTGLCGLCGEVLDRDLAWPDPMSKSLDHIVPLSTGGTHEQSNLQWAHLVCNVRKGPRAT